MMNALFAGIKLIITLVAAYALYGMLAYEHPTALRQLTRLARAAIDELDSLNVADQYMVWLDVLLQPANVIIITFAVIMRIIISILWSIISTRSG